MVGLILGLAVFGIEQTEEKVLQGEFSLTQKRQSGK
jgi:hypothetical protein